MDVDDISAIESSGVSFPSATNSDCNEAEFISDDFSVAKLATVEIISEGGNKGK